MILIICAGSLHYRSDMSINQLKINYSNSHRFFLYTQKKTLSLYNND